MKKRYGLGLTTAIAAAIGLGAGPGLASSHREAPAITEMPKVDSTDLYMFRSYEPGREGFVTFIANYQPFQEPFGGPNYFTMDPDAIYEIHIDNDGNAAEDLTFQFKFINQLVNNTGLTIDVGGKVLPVPVRNLGQITQVDDPDLGERETFTLTLITGDRRTGTRAPIVNAQNQSQFFRKPVDNIGQKSIPNYDAYAAQFMSPITIPGCATPGRVFVGQRAEAFAVNVGEIFDLVNFVPIEGMTVQSRERDDLVGKLNVTSFALEVPIACLTGTGNNGVIGAWQTASLPQAKLHDPTPTYQAPALYGGAFVQVSRLSHPLVNEVVIGIPQKDLFNAAEPTGDAALADYVTNPTFPAILDVLFRAPVNAAIGGSGSIAPRNFPRRDLVATFLTGIATLNQQRVVTPSEIMRLNTAIAPTPRASQSNFGVVGDDLAGYPNGRRPGDDTVDITLRVAMGRLCYPVPIKGAQTNLGLCTPQDAPSGNVPYTDGAPLNARDLQNAFPYLNTPIPGSPDSAREARRGG